MNLTEFKVLTLIVCSVFLLSYWSRETGAQMYVDYWRPSGRFGKRGHSKVEKRMKTKKMLHGNMLRLLRDSQVKDPVSRQYDSNSIRDLSRRVNVMGAMDGFYQDLDY